MNLAPREGNLVTKLIIAALVAAPLLMLEGCSDNPPAAAKKPPEEPAVKLADEYTSETQIPSVLESELTPDEKSALLKEIMPPASPNEPTPEEKFLKLRQEAEAGDPKAQNGLGVMYYTGEAISKDP